MSYEDCKRRYYQRMSALPTDADACSMTAIVMCGALADCYELLRMVEGLCDVTVVADELRPKAPLLLYFASPEEREGFVQAVQTVAPLQPVVRLPIVGPK